MDSDDQNFNKKCDIDEDDDDDAFVEYQVSTKCCDKINDDFAENQCCDANGNKVNIEHQNDVECDCLSGIEVDSQIKNTISESNDNAMPKDENTMNKLMSMTLSEYGTSHT